MTNKARTASQDWETILRQAIEDYRTAGGNVQQLATASGFQAIAIWQFLRGERTTLTLRSANKLGDVLGLTIGPVTRRRKLTGTLGNTTG